MGVSPQLRYYYHKKDDHRHCNPERCPKKRIEITQAKNPKPEEPKAEETTTYEVEEVIITPYDWYVDDIDKCMARDTLIGAPAVWAEMIEWCRKFADLLFEEQAAMAYSLPAEEADWTDKDKAACDRMIAATESRRQFETENGIRLTGLYWALHRKLWNREYVKMHELKRTVDKLPDSIRSIVYRDWEPYL